MSAAMHTPLTRVMLVFVPDRCNVWLRFGQPIRVVPIDRWRRCADFAPHTIFCRVRWVANAYGTIVWQLAVLQTAAPQSTMRHIAGVLPGAVPLLQVTTEGRVQQVLQLIDTIEAHAISPVDVSPHYWQMLHNRLAARLPLPLYTAERHAAHRAREAFE